MKPTSTSGGNSLSLPSDGLFPGTVPQAACPRPSTWSSRCPACDGVSPSSPTGSRMLLAHPSLTALFHLSLLQNGLPWWLKQSRVCLRCERPRLDPWIRQIPLGKATHSSILAWEMPRTEDPGGLQSMGVTNHQTQLSN